MTETSTSIPPAEGTSEKFTILLVDDLKENLIALEEMLQEENRQFIKATSGVEALKLVLTTPDIGLILLDVQMPDMDGFEVAKLLSSNLKTRDIPFLFVTASNTQSKFVLEGYNKGAIDYLIKPLNVQITRAKVSVFENLYQHQQRLKKALHERDLINKQLEKYTKIIAHDLKSPLASISSLVSLLRMNKDVMSIPAAMEDLELIDELTSNLSGMIISVLEESRKAGSEQKPETVNVKELLQFIISILRPPANIRVQLQSSFPVIETRKIKLQQVFQNLMSNAIKYIDKPEGLIEIGFEEDETFCTFFIKDNGPGIAAEHHQKIFELYQTGEAVSTRDSSTGLGLNFVKSIVEEQGGKIWITSQLQAGSTFFFTWKK